MLSILIPGFREDELHLQHLMVDFNGTLAIDGKLIAGVKEKLNLISEKLQVHIVTGNSFGTAEKELEGISCTLKLLSAHNQNIEKGKYVEMLGKESVISIGNGSKDREMVQRSVIGIILIQKEGASVEALMVSNIACTNILDALDLIDNPKRISATLRS
ncbi:ATPase P [Kaistella flava (ex Peng et al. 2021)]|uniref:ATPase P n=1 Tax=Kaistella flava (ex Peng et al. 2021) TaxID=2038776 RepID=A0A7M2YCD0_9FLAO|nr:ATPase P [Kaistella flava (ex Peng et al. 2021)]QOW11690.1 ATPase P [Kaistella flava (ex Peng et al. 2021)]